jgi:hypothetical protein
LPEGNFPSRVITAFYLGSNARLSQKEGIVNHDYDVFEIYPDHSIKWRISVHGTQNALATLEALTKQTVNECFASDMDTQEIVGHVNEGRASARILDDDGFAAN